MVLRRNSRFAAVMLGGLCAAALGACGGDDDDDDDVMRVGATGGSGGKGGTSSGGTSSGGTSSGKGGTSTGGTAGTSSGGTSTGGSTMIDPEDYDGQEVFRHDTFGNERFWTDELMLHEAIQAALDPVTALSLGLKVDASVLPEGILDEVDLEDPATTVALLELDAVIGVKGVVEDGELVSVGITCALCHSDVDDSVMEGIGVRIDGPANRDLDPGAIIALAPALADNDEAQEVLNGWGPGFFDARWNQDGIDHAVLIPPIYGLDGVPLETYTGDGPVSYWNAYVAITQMGAIGNFFDPRIDVAVFFDEDLVGPKLPSLFEYQMTLSPPEVADDAFDPDAAERGQALFEGAAQCSSCHSGPTLTDAPVLHAPEETGMEPVTAERSATGRYRTTPLRGLLDHPPYFHDGSAETLADVVTHYDGELDLGLTEDEQADLVEYLNSL